MNTELSRYFLSSFTSLAPLINPPGSAMELLGIVGFKDRQIYRNLARKIAVNTIVFLTLTGLAGPYLLRCFGISIGILQFMGGLVLVGLGWSMLHKEDGAAHVSVPNVISPRGSEEAYWQSRAFYPLTYPITVGPCSVSVMLTLSTQVNTLMPANRVMAWIGMVLCLLLMSILIYVCYALAPLAAGAVSPGIVSSLMKITPFLILCVGAQLSWNGLQSLLKTMHT